jgi:dipeptidyl aminopeptidase/acylaminoacyl peptidase
MTAFTVDDLYQHKKIIDLHGSMDHSKTFGTVRSAKPEANNYSTQIWRFHSTGEAARPVTMGDGSDSSPRLSPDGLTLAFLSSRGGKTSQVFLLPLDGGEARQLGDFSEGVSSLRWAPDSKSLFLAIPTPVVPDLRGKRGKEPEPASADDPEVCWKLPYKNDGVGYLLKREMQVFRIELESAETSRITDGHFDVMSFEPSQDGQHLAYVRSRDGKYAHLTDLWICDVEGKTHRRVTRDLATVMQPSWSPDSAFIAFAGAIKQGDGEARLWLLDVQTEAVRSVGGDAMEVADPQAIFWHKNGQHLYLSRAWRGRHQVVCVDTASEDVETVVTGDRQIGAMAPAAGGIVFSSQSPIAPEELFYQPFGAGPERQLSDLNSWWLSRTPMEMTARSFEVPDGKGGTEKIEGWLLRSSDAPKDSPAPLLNDIHGGPASYALLDYDSNVYWQALCSRGWTILLLNAVGSSSYGDEFCARLSGNWGEMDFPQHSAVIKQLQAEKVCDERVCITGKSYGGYLSGWAVSHSGMFKAAVVMAPVGNIETHYGTSDGGYYADPLYIGTAPRFDREKARELSPLQFIENARTPTLFLQGKDDERCPKCQSEELFVSLYTSGNTKTELVLYPGEGHLFLSEGKPKCRADAATRIMDWHISHTAH